MKEENLNPHDYFFGFDKEKILEHADKLNEKDQLSYLNEVVTTASIEIINLTEEKPESEFDIILKETIKGDLSNLCIFLGFKIKRLERKINLEGTRTPQEMSNEDKDAIIEDKDAIIEFLHQYKNKLFNENESGNIDYDALVQGELEKVLSKLLYSKFIIYKRKGYHEEIGLSISPIWGKFKDKYGNNKRGFLKKHYKCILKKLDFDEEDLKIESFERYV